MIININNKNKGQVVNNSEQFTVEFYAYNISSQGLVKKVYFFPTLLSDKESISLSQEEIDLVSKALENESLLSFIPERYTLCDLSLRGTEHVENIGFNFKIINDSRYINPSHVFEKYSNFNVKDFCDTVIRIQKALFSDKPKFNPISMIGLLFDEISLKSIKAYIRFDYGEVKTTYARKELVKNVINTINSESKSKKEFLNFTKVSENLGFQFVFVGIDCDIAGNNRFKLYFSTHGKYDPLITFREIKHILTSFNLYNNIEEVFNENKNRMWGFAISTADFTDVKGIQLYFYP